MVVIQHGRSLDHAWLESAAGVVDPTPVDAAVEEGSCTYFAGPRWTLGAIHALFSAEQDEIVTPILASDFATDTPRRQAWIGGLPTRVRAPSAADRAARR